MKKKSARRVHHKKVTVRKSASVSTPKKYLMWIRGWMFVVMFALMLGIGAIVGNFLNQQLNNSTPTVAGVETEFQGDYGDYLDY